MQDRAGEIGMAEVAPADCDSFDRIMMRQIGPVRRPRGRRETASCLAMIFVEFSLIESGSVFALFGACS